MTPRLERVGQTRPRRRRVPRRASRAGAGPRAIDPPISPVPTTSARRRAVGLSRGGHRGALGRRGGRRACISSRDLRRCGRGGGPGCTAAWSPGTAISAAHRSGTAPNPISRMAVAGNDARHVRRGREEHADDVVLDQPVAVHELAHELLGALGDLGHRVRVDRRRPAQTPDRESGCHGGSLYRDRLAHPRLTRSSYAVVRPATPGTAAAASARTSPGSRGRQWPGGERGVAHGPDAGAHEAPHRVADGARTCGGPGGCAPRGSRGAGRPGASTPTSAGAVEAVVELDALAQRPQRPGGRRAAARPRPRTPWPPRATDG